MRTDRPIDDHVVKTYRCSDQKSIDTFFSLYDHVELFKDDFVYRKDPFRMDYGYGCFMYEWRIVEITFNQSVTKYALARSRIDGDKEVSLFRKHCQCDYCTSWGPTKLIYMKVPCFRTEDEFLTKWSPEKHALMRKTRAYLRKKDLI